MLQVEEVRSAASGRWLQILEKMEPSLDAAISRIGRHVQCPVHGGKDGFRLFHDADLTGGGVCNTCGYFSDGFALISWLKNWQFKEALAAVAAELHVSGTNSTRNATPGVAVARRAPSVPKRSEESDNRLRALLLAMWSEAVPITHPQAMAAQRYFVRRKLSVRYAGTLHQALRFHPKIAYLDEKGKLVAYYPALLANISDQEGNMVTLHRTYLGQDGCKAPVEEPRKMMPIPNGKSVAGCSIKLGTPTTNVIGYAEGIETALSAYAGSGTVVWSTVNANLMELSMPPRNIELVFAWADFDISRRGEEAAKILKKRLWEKGIRTQILLPPMPLPKDAPGVDWNDAWVAYGHTAFPHRALLARVA
jgi:hypothetical protein